MRQGADAGIVTGAGAVLAPAGRPVNTSDLEKYKTSWRSGLIAVLPALRAPAIPGGSRGARLMQVFWLLLLMTCLVPGMAQAVPAGTVIVNTAGAEFEMDGYPQSAFSNSVSITTMVFGTQSTLEVLRYAPTSPSVSLTVSATSYFDGSGFTPAPAPPDPATGISINLAAPVPLEPATDFSQGDPVFILLDDPDGNSDPAVADTIRVDIEDGGSAVIETLLLTETGADTGTFTGYIRSGAASENSNDGILYGYAGAQFSAAYADPTDSTDTSSAPFLFDPMGVLWVSASAGKNTVSVGDYLTYTITVENTSANTVPGTVLTTDLPVGFRYEPGSTRTDGSASPDPLTAPDGRSLAFSIGDVPPGGTVSITFVARVGAGVKPGKAAAANLASSGALLSNTATATVRIVDELFRTRNVIMGRVLSGACGEGGQEGVPGVRIFLEDGTYVVTDELGRYHFEGVQSGTHVVQMDLETVPEMYDAVACDDDTRQAGRPWSRFVDLAGGALWRVDFNLVPKSPEEGRASLVLRTEGKAGGVSFSASMRGEQVPLRNVRFKVSLPGGVEYMPGSARLEGKAIGDPEIQGSTLMWNVGEVAGVWEKGLTFETRVIDDWQWSRDSEIRHLDPDDGTATAKLVQGDILEVGSDASVLFDTPAQKDISTPEVRNVLLKVAEREEYRTSKFVFRPHFGTFEATLTAEDRDALDIISKIFDPEEIGHVQVIGHTDSVPISERGKRIYADNYELSKSRARSMAYYLMDVWGLSTDSFTIEGRGPDEPLADNDTVKGKSLNRRVEVNVITTTIERRMELKPLSDQNRTEVTITGLRPGEPSPFLSGETQLEDTTEEVEEASPEIDWKSFTKGEFAWVFPEADFTPRVPGIKVAVSHDPRGRVRLTVNGAEPDELTFMGTQVNSEGTEALSLWRGIELKEGDNLLRAEEISSLGLVVRALQRSIHLSGPPTDAQLLPDESYLVADGRNPPTIAVRLTDGDGYPARYRSMGQYFVEKPHQPYRQGGGNVDAFFGVEKDGVAKLKLKPTVRTGEATVRVKLQGGEKEITVWLEPEKRDWILVGLAEGTAGYNTVSGNMRSFKDSGGEEDLYTDGRVAFFAKGQIKGKYLLTMQYDTGGPHGAAGTGLSGTIDPDTYYTLYGDSTEQGYEAPTSKKLYLKIERKQFYALFGDTETGLTVTELSRYDRRFTGFRSEFRSQDFSYNLFASETGQAFSKDEIPGNGTSGLYHLSSNQVVINSETVRIEVRDRFQSHVILSSEKLARHADYNIDYDEGTLFFKAPVPQRDTGFNPVYIVVEYETDDPGAKGLTYGARVQKQIPGSEVSLGVSHVHEDRGSGKGDLVGVDMAAQLSDRIHLRAEAASTRDELYGAESDGSAYVLEVTHSSTEFQGRIYLREQESGFGLGQQMSSESGTRKAGFEGLYRLSDNWDLNGEMTYQEYTGADTERHVEALGLTRNSGNISYSAGVKRATDTDSDGTVERSQLLTAGVNWQSEDGRLKLKADHEQAVGDNDNTDYPTRTLLAADHSLNDSVSLYAEQEYTDGNETSVSATRLGMKANPWKGGTASSGVNRNYNENSERVYATTGLNQTLKLSERWSLSAGYEGARVLKESTSEPLNPSIPPASSDEDYTAVSIGAGYVVDHWDFDVRLEARYSDVSDKRGVISGLFGEPVDGIGISTDLKHFITDSKTGSDTTQTDLRLGFAYRPFERKWTFLDKLEYSVEEERGLLTDLTAWKVVNNFNANLKASDDLQVSFQYGAKYVKDTISGEVYSGVTQLLGAEGRYDLNPTWDIGAWASFLTAPDTGTSDYGIGASVGYGLMENLWLSFGYNMQGYDDADFSQGDFTAQGPFVKFRFKFDQEDLRGLLKR